MKTFSQRSDIVVLGSGLAGICAALSAARAGAIVNLIEPRAYMGGRIGKETKFPYDFQGTTNFAYQRETGILDEILTSIFEGNSEGSYSGQDRSLFDIINKEERLNIFLETRLFEVKKNQSGDKIESILGISPKHGGRILFRAPYFIDCSTSAELCQIAKVAGEYGLDQIEYEKSSVQTIPVRFRASTSMQIEIEEKKVPFVCPGWVTLKWEDNGMSAQIELLESLSRKVVGVHSVEWLGKAKNELKLESAQLVWSAWDYLKNRSPLMKRAKNWVVKDFSPVAINSQGFRAHGEYVLTPDDMETGKHFYDSVALGRAPLDVANSLLNSPRGKIALPQPFEIPLRSLYSKKIKNLFFAGEHSSATSRASASFSHPPTSAQMGEAVGLCAALCIDKNRLPRTISKPGNIEIFKKKLSKSNHSFSLLSFEDSDNLIPDSRVVASTTLESFVRSSETPRKSIRLTNKGLIQFPLGTNFISEIFIFIEVLKNCTIEIRLLENSSGVNTIPGNCLSTVFKDLDSGGPRWEMVPINSKINKIGWHFIEFDLVDDIVLYEQQNAPVGLLSYSNLNRTSAGILNPYSEYFPVLPTNPSLSSALAFDISPKQPVFKADNVIDSSSRPGLLPNLWISEETEFQYPEYLEFHWKDPTDLTSIEIVWDSTLEYLFPSRPQKLTSTVLPSIVKDYKIYFMNDVGHWVEFISVIGNKLGFSTHYFDNIKTQAIEIEILNTHGLNRAQVYQVRAYS